MVTMSRLGVTTVVIMLGTNDSKPWINTSPADYQANLQFIVDQLAGIGVTKIVLNQPPYIQPAPAPDGIPDPTVCNALLVQYQTNLSNLVTANPGLVFLGDTTAYSVFESNPSYYQADGIHPNNTGAGILGNLWTASDPI